MKFYTYIIYNKSRDRSYVGYCNNIDSRLEKHNSGATKSTKSGRPWIFQYLESFNSKREAILRELEIKRKKSRIYIVNLIRSSGDPKFVK